MDLEGRAPHNKLVRTAALAQVFFGGVCLVSSVSCIFAVCWGHFLAVGSWTGLMFVATGIVSCLYLGSGSGKYSCLVRLRPSRSTGTACGGGR